MESVNNARVGPDIEKYESAPEPKEEQDWNISTANRLPNGTRIVSRKVSASNATVNVFLLERNDPRRWEIVRLNRKGEIVNLYCTYGGLPSATDGFMSIARTIT